jgi:hypothetical protein
MQGSTVMRQSSAEALVTEEPYALIAHVRVWGGAGWVTTGSTRNQRVADGEGSADRDFLFLQDV